jgi:N-6 DNA Methylase
VIVMSKVNQWLERLGYASEPESLHRAGQDVRGNHPYALEIRSLLRSDGAVRAKAVFDVEGVPTIVFLGGDSSPLTSDELDDARKRIWNQNLATVVIDVHGNLATAVPVRKLAAKQVLTLGDAAADGPFSVSDVSSASLPRRLPNWFDVKARVDQQLLANLSATASLLSDKGFSGVQKASDRRRLAELLMGQVLFVSYLEHREIAGPTYRQRRQVQQLQDLVSAGNRDGINQLIDRLRGDFNGDFLGSDRHDPWSAITTKGFELLSLFLSRTDMETGQGSFWNYDFSYIPVELLSGVYESFLTPEQQAEHGAYYTPRNLAMFAVDQAFAHSKDLLEETIFDGACGSGILLTTAYRRLIAHAEARRGEKLGFAQRGELLKARIFGSDINFMACRVTAFSLYLSLLEGLNPKDILEAQERDGTKLPSLSGTNLCHGAKEGDFFGKEHPFADKQFSLIISNPPWTEPEGESFTSADAWAETANAPFVRRQMAGAFALKALEFLGRGGRACLILPIGQLLAPSSDKFIARLLTAYRPQRVVNFGDLQGLLFPTAENTCHVFVGEKREATHVVFPMEGSNQPRMLARVPFGETFDYCVPKADMSLALGRLTMQSADRHTVQTRDVIEDPMLLVTFMWGDAQDLSILTRLSAIGTFADFWHGPKSSRRWVNRKGIHVKDKSRDPVSSAPLQAMKFIDPAALRAGSPLLHPKLLRPWPVAHDTVVGLTDEVMAVFNGPRVVFPDGFSKGEQNVRAVYLEQPASFTHSIGVIAGPPEDANLLKFVAVYLRSSLARYFLMMRGWKMLCERNGLHLSDVEAFPFFDVDAAPNPERARQALSRVVAHMRELEATDELSQADAYELRRDALDEAVYEYFGLSEKEQRFVTETVEVLMSSIRPRSFRSLDTPAQGQTHPEQVPAYAQTLGDALEEWRDRMGGTGRFTVSTVISEINTVGATGIVRVAYDSGQASPSSIDTTVSDHLVMLTLKELRKAGLRVVSSGTVLDLVPDAHVWIGELLYFVRPMNRRSWTSRQALRDAERIVRMVTRHQDTTDVGSIA